MQSAANQDHITDNKPVHSDIIVIGNGMVGHHFVEQLREQNSEMSIKVLCGEPILAYDRVHLSDLFRLFPATNSRIVWFIARLKIYMLFKNQLRKARLVW